MQYIGNIDKEQWEKLLLAAGKRLETAKKKFFKAKIKGIFWTALLCNYELTTNILK